MGTFGRLVFCAVRTQLVGETSVSRQLSGCFFVQRDKLGAGVVVREDLAVVRAVFGHVFRAVLRQTDAVAVADGVEGERVISGRDREIGRAQTEQLAHISLFALNIINMIRYYKASQNVPHRTVVEQVDQALHQQLELKKAR